MEEERRHTALILKLSALESKRDGKRNNIEENFEQRATVRLQLIELQRRQESLMEENKSLESELQSLDDAIASLEHEIMMPPGVDSEAGTSVVQRRRSPSGAITSQEEALASDIEHDMRSQQTQVSPFIEDGTQISQGDILTDPQTFTMADHDEFLTEPTNPCDTQQGPQETRMSHAYFTKGLKQSDRVANIDQTVCTSTAGGEMVPIHPKKLSRVEAQKPPAAASIPANPFFAPRQRSGAPKGTTLQFSQTQRDQDEQEQLQQYEAEVESLSISNSNNFQQPEEQNKWKKQIDLLLRQTFKIPSFRQYQEGIIDATLAGKDVFVIMRTGGGKSLTYQLPALLEGRGPDRKITVVVSPLLSLITDQEEQLNQLCSNSAISFTSSLSAAEHAKRWAAVRDPNGGVCLMLVTPEKVSQSPQLESELQKLYRSNRFGRIVIDEAHCATQWGHDFRPDYVQLGKLKRLFPSVPLLAVTATASDRVRDDVCQILRMQQDYTFVRSTADRPNLKYIVMAKSDKKEQIIDDMAKFINENHPNDAGIVYTFSRKEAEDVASKLKTRGITAEPYHSSISPAAKKRIHKSWMRNKTRVVVATIAFGLGINKPDVRFVLHHSISKTLEAYYQESGRAGRDGLPADCVLWYSPRDVARMLGMISGTSAERCTFWPMVRYGQAHGTDAVCRAILLKKLGEPNSPDPAVVHCDNEGITSECRNVTEHVRTLLQLLQSKHKSKLTMSMFVKEWRVRSPTLQSLKDNPPNKDLTTDECERIIVMLLVEEIINPRVVTNKYASCVYIESGSKVQQMVASNELNVSIHLPKRVAKVTARESIIRSTGNSNKKKASSWTESRKPKAKRRRSSGLGNNDNPLRSGNAKSKKVKKNATSTRSDAVIDLADSEVDGSSFEGEASAQQPRRTAAARKNQTEDLWDDDETDDDF